jgi:6-carboxyhexanoate--CoA ligase
VITIESVLRRPKMIRALPVTTLECGSPSEARSFIQKVLRATGISLTACRNALRLLNGNNSMRGASLIRCESGIRVEPDKKRGIRASRFGIERSAGDKLSMELLRNGINTVTVKEALILASKVASCTEVVAELCVSDDPGYTTGYFSSKKYGYVRIPNIKKKNAKNGGRVFFIAEDADRESVIDFLEDTPVLIDRTGGCCGECAIDEILDHHHR